MSGLQPHQQRVVEEREALNKRLASLHSFINSETFPSVDRSERSRLIRQEAIMIELSRVLAERIAAFEVSCAEPEDFPLGNACDLSGEGTCEACQ